MSPLRRMLVAVKILGLSAFGVVISACGGGSSAPSVPPSYTLSASALSPSSVTAGNPSTSTITLTPVGGYTGSITLSCGTISGGSSVPSCSFSPAVVSVNGAAVTATLTVSSSINTPGGSYAITVDASDAEKSAPSNGAQALSLKMAAVIQHVVIIFQENRSTDNLFQDPVLVSRGADIKTSGLNTAGQTVTLTPNDLGTAGTTPQDYDLGHAHSDFVSMYDGGKMDGANLIECYVKGVRCTAGTYPNAAYHYVLPADIAPYFALAEQYTFGDRMFQSNEGPSMPAHQFIFSGTSAPAVGSTLFASENPTNNYNGCIAPAGTLVTLIDAAGSETAQPPIYPCFEHQTLADLLTAKDVSWRYYTPIADYIWTAPVAISHICEADTVTLTCTGTEWTNNVVIPQSKVLTDIANGKLAQVSWVIPNGTSSDHAGINDGTGPSWVASIVNAIGNSAYWANTAIIITWDDWGGWYDHVAPKVINDGVSWGSGYVYGFRVPLIVVSPYAKAAYISHVTHDFGSILKFIETTYDLPSLNYADAQADDLSDCFDLTQTPLTFKAIPAKVAAAEFINDKRPPVDPDDD